ncbi:MAG: phospho-N-acetylmuramoyl-pentapeptide-transferase [Candidatus Hydrogenedentota bacterium]
MFYHLVYKLSVYFSPFNVFKYITFRTAYAAITAFLFCLIVGPYFIKKLKEMKIQHQRGEEKLDHHLDKVGTPTMGGALILGAIFFSMILWGNFANVYVWIVLIVSLLLGIVGFVDDYLKWTYADSKGLKAHYKFLAQIVIATGVAAYLYIYPIKGLNLWSPERFIDMKFGYCLTAPFLKNFVVYLGVFYIPFVVLVIVGSSNAVNLTDGLDGLAIGCVIFTALALSVFTYLTGHFKFSQYLNLNFIRESSELTVFLGAMIGAGMGFLWFNAHPASIFMGDTGSLSLGGVIGTIVVLIKQEIVLLIIGGIFVIEALSVILQVAYFKITGGKRLFMMSPIHHHFELKGLHESKIIVRFWIVAILLALIGLSTIKLR